MGTPCHRVLFAFLSLHFLCEVARPDELPARMIARLGPVRLRHTAKVRAMAISADGKIATVQAFDNTIRIWDSSSGKLLHTIAAPGVFAGREPPYDHHLAFTSDGKRISAVVNTEVWFWDAQTGRELHRFSVAGQALHSPVAASDNKTKVKFGTISLSLRGLLSKLS